MIAAPLNDVECLGQLTEVAKGGISRPEVRELASRFGDPGRLAAWIRELPQRDDTGDPTDGPRVACDVPQRARLVADDPNCVERAILYLAAAEVIDPRPVRQLATVDISRTLRHTFPLDDGEPVVLDPSVPRNALRGQVWTQRNGAGAGPAESLDGEAVLAWLLELAEDEGFERDGEQGATRVALASAAIDRLLSDQRISAYERADVLYALRRAGDAAGWFGRIGSEGYRAGRALVARLMCRSPPAPTRAARRIRPGKAVYWAGNAVATYYGVGGLYEAAYQEVEKRDRGRPGLPTTQTNEAPAAVVVPVTPVALVNDEEIEAPGASALGTLEEVSEQKGELES